MDRTQPFFEHILIPEINYSNYPIEFVEEDHLDCLHDVSEDQKIESIEGMESTQVKTEPEINIEEIKFDPLEDHLYCLPKDAGMESTQVKTESTEENLTSEIDIEEHPIKFESMENHMYCLPKNGVGKKSVRNNENEIVKILECDECGISFTCPEILDWHTENCHGILAIVKVVKISDKKVHYLCWLCNGMFIGLQQIIPHLELQHQVENWPLRCNLCDITFMAKPHFMEHKLVCNKNNTAHDNLKKSKEPSTSVIIRRNITNARNSGERQLECVLPHNIDGTLLQQNNKKEPQQSHQCKHCGISYTNLEMLDWHIEHCHGPDPKIKVLRTGNFTSGYQCILCEVKIHKIEIIIQHLLNEHQLSKLPFQCNICKGRQFITKSSLMKHKCKKKTSQLEHNDLQLNDGQQPTVEISSPEVEDHTVKVEPEDDQMDLPEHQNNFEAVSRPNNKKHYSRRFHCGHCDLRYAHREMLIWHIEHCHGPDPKIKVLQNGHMVVGFKCVFCEAEINQFKLIIQHLRYQHLLSILPYHCNICKCRQFTTKCYLKKHKLICHKRKSQVKHSSLRKNDGLQRTKKNSFQEMKDRTIKIETGDDQLDLHEHQINDVEPTQGKNLLECRVLVPKLLECGMCSFYTDNKSQLESHMQEHLTPNASGRWRSQSHPGAAAATKKSFNHGCSECGKKYFRPEMLAWHSENCHGADAIVKIIKVKKNLGKYQCVFCKTLCVGLTVMIQHLKNHHRLSNLPFRCDFCDNRFILLTNLSNHRLKCNEKDFFHSPTKLLNTEKKFSVKCKMCDENFETKMKRRKHISDFHATLIDLRYKCQYCDQSFSTHSQFKLHCHKIHPGKPKILQCSVCKADEFTSYQNDNGLKRYARLGVGFNCKCAAKFPYVGNLQNRIQNVRSKKKFPMQFLCRKI